MSTRKVAPHCSHGRFSEGPFLPAEARGKFRGSGTYVQSKGEMKHHSGEFHVGRKSSSPGQNHFQFRQEVGNPDKSKESQAVFDEQNGVQKGSLLNGLPI